jgi:DNA-binding NarL/FixJ family response regulator
MLAAGLSNAEVAEALTFSHVLGKLELRDRVQAVIYAYETGLIARPG